MAERWECHMIGREESLLNVKDLGEIQGKRKHEVHERKGELQGEEGLWGRKRPVAKDTGLFYFDVLS